MEKIRVLVVDDSLFMRKVISDLLSLDSEIEVVGQAADGDVALVAITQLKPQVITLDYEMPHRNGLQTLLDIEKLPDPPKVIMVSGHTAQDADLTLRCLKAGAVDFVLKPSGTLSMDMSSVRDLLIEKIKIAAQTGKKLSQQAVSGQEIPSLPNYRSRLNGVVVIGASTGGPAALEVLLPAFPTSFPLPILVVQHLPKHFTATMAERLNKLTQIPVVEAQDGLRVIPAKIYIAPGGLNMEVKQASDMQVMCHVFANTIGTETPSIDALMMSAAQVYREQTVGVILTGMGKDGVVGMTAIKEVGGTTLVQDESTSVVFGMGREVVEKGVADDIVPLGQVVNRIIVALQ